MEYLEQYKFSMFNHKVFKDGKLFCKRLIFG